MTWEERSMADECLALDQILKQVLLGVEKGVLSSSPFLLTAMLVAVDQMFLFPFEEIRYILKTLSLLTSPQGKHRPWVGNEQSERAPNVSELTLSAQRCWWRRLSTKDWTENYLPRLRLPSEVWEEHEPSMTRDAEPSSELGKAGGQEMEQGPGTISPSPIIKGEEGKTVCLPSSLVLFPLSFYLTSTTPAP